MGLSTSLYHRDDIKNILKSKYCVIRSISLCLLDDNYDCDERLLIAHTVDVSNTLYESDILSVCELCLGSGKPINGKPGIIPDEILNS